MAERVQLRGLGLVADLVGDLPDYFLAYLAKYYEPYYELRTEGCDAPADLRIAVELDGRVLDGLRSGAGRPLGRVPLDLTTGGHLRAREDGTQCAVSDAGNFAVAQTADGGLVLAAAGPEPAVLQHFVIRIDVALISRRVAAGGLAPVHAAAVSLGDVGVLIGGSKGAGKTSLSLALAALEGCDFVSNELVLVGRDGAGLAMHGTPIPPRIGAGTLRAHPRLLDALDPFQSSQVQLAPSDWHESQEYKVDLSVRTIRRALDLEVRPAAPLAAVLWPRIAEGDAVGVRPLPREEARAAVASSLLLFDPHWLSWDRVGFNGLPPLPGGMVASQHAIAELPNYSAVGARRVEDLAHAVVDQLRGRL